MCNVSLASDSFHSQQETLGAEGGSDEMGIPAFTQMQLLAEVGHRDGEAADSEIGSWNVCKQAAEFFLGEGGTVNDLPATTREVGDEMVGSIEVGVGGQFLYRIALADSLVGSSLQDTGIGLIEISADGISQNEW